MKAIYDKNTWAEIRDGDKDRVAILPIAATEDHGPHLPLDTDTLIATRLVTTLADRFPEELVVMPTIPYGFNAHHFDFPGVIHIEPETLIAFLTDITKSLARHGFRRILILNSHGSNAPVIDLAARKTVIATEIICVSASHWTLSTEAINEIRRSEMGGIAHAGELETALYLHHDPDNVQMDKAVSQVVHDPDSRFFNLDLAGGSKAMLMRWWSAMSPDGTMGDPTVADAEQGRKFFEAAVEATIALVREIRALPMPARKDHH
jgi:creatinine amidohydrolase